VTQDGTIPQRQHGGHPLPLDVCRDVADCVYAAVESVQATRPATFRHRTVAEAGRPQLADRHRAMLAARMLRNVKVRGAFLLHRFNKAPGPPIRPPTTLLPSGQWNARSAILRLSLAPWARGFSL
jgi:hypothetical protein